MHLYSGTMQTSKQCSCRPGLKASMPVRTFSSDLAGQTRARRDIRLNVAKPPSEQQTVRITNEAEDKADEGAQQAQTIAEQASEVAGGVMADIRAEWQGFDVKGLLVDTFDTKKVGGRGEGWFAAQVAVILCLIFPPAALKIAVDVGAVASILAGLAFILSGLKDLGNSLSPFPAPREGAKLITSGAFEYVRHPMYAGVLFCAFGLSAITASEARFVLSAVLFAILNRKANLEEAALLDIHSEYPDYQKKVPKLIPYVY